MNTYLKEDFENISEYIKGSKNKIFGPFYYHKSDIAL